MPDNQNKQAAPGVRKVTVLGAGAWGTAVAIALAQRHDVLLWGRNSAALQAMGDARDNTEYLPGHPFPDRLQVAAGFDTACGLSCSSSGRRPATGQAAINRPSACLLYTSPSPRDATLSRMPSSA